MSSTELSTPTRIQSVDILRGIVMVLMAIDHVRVYSGLPAGGPDPGIFFTRWVTHFCAPGFVFFAGTSAFLYGKKINDANALMRYLLTRGLLLVFLELTLIRFSWTFNFNYAEFTLAGVIWMLGWCMVMMSLLVRLSPSIIAFGGLVIITFQQIFWYVPRLLPPSTWSSFGGFWEFIYPADLNPLFGINVLYVLVPWIGVMMAGYGFGAILVQESEKRNKLCLSIGLTAIALFIVAGSILTLTNPDAPPFIFSLLNQRKYPASVLFLMMTIGPMIALVPFTEKTRGWFAEIMKVFGRVPMFYYLLHIPLIHISALLVNLILYGSIHQEWYNTAPYTWMPEESRWSLPLLYLVFFIDVAILYFACRWYVRYKFSHPDNPWLKYL